MSQGYYIRGNKVVVVDPTTGKGAGVDGLGHLDVIRHAHEEGGLVNMQTGTLSASQDFILVDLSDTTNYPHENTSWIHLAWINIQVDSDNSGAYEIAFGFLENVDATDGDFHEIGRVGGSKQAGNNIGGFWSMLPEGPKCRSESFAGPISANDTAFQTDVNLADTITPGSATVPSGSGDLVMRVIHTAGTYAISVQAYYHTH